MGKVLNGALCGIVIPGPRMSIARNSSRGKLTHLYSQSFPIVATRRTKQNGNDMIVASKIRCLFCIEKMILCVEVRGVRKNGRRKCVARFACVFCCILTQKSETEFRDAQTSITRCSSTSTYTGSGIVPKVKPRSEGGAEPRITANIHESRAPIMT